jgi:electron transfer flavoprotein beta subunit
MAKILVPIKRVPDFAQKVKISASGDSIVTDGIKWILNPFDEIAVEEAIRIKEKSGSVEEIVVVSIGPKEISEQLRTALAMGADRAILVEAPLSIDSDVAHRVFVEIFKKDKFDLVIMGKQAIDSDANQTAQLLAAKLGIAQATFASKVEISSDWTSANITREVDGGLETLAVKLPAVVSTDLRLNEPRYPSLPGIVKAKKKPLEEIPIASLGVVTQPKVVVRKMSLPKQRSAGIKVASISELIDKLRNEAKVI